MWVCFVIVLLQWIVELCEIVLCDKVFEFLFVLFSGMVFCFVVEGQLIDESLDVMKWVLVQNDLENWLFMLVEGWDLIEWCDGLFKCVLDCIKYVICYFDEDFEENCDFVMVFFWDLDVRIDQWIFDYLMIVDYVILLFVCQFVYIDKVWFDVQNLLFVYRWLVMFFLVLWFIDIMLKYDKWQVGDDLIFFGFV